MRIPITLYFLLLLAGCDIVDARVCTLELRTNIYVTATDSITGSPVTADLRGFVRDGSFQEQMSSHPAMPGILFLGESERAGVYEVVVNATGYREWRMTNVRVTADECHVETRSLNARLIPQN